MKILCHALLLCLFLIAPNVLNAQSKDEIAVRKALQTWIDALTHNDIKALEKIVDKAYVTTTADGKVLSRDEDLAWVKSGDMQFESITTEDLKVKVFGPTAIVTGVGVFKVKYKGTPIESRERFTDVYQKQSGEWHPIASHSTSLPRPKKS